jgi:hypothetical protein
MVAFPRSCSAEQCAALGDASQDTADSVRLACSVSNCHARLPSLGSTAMPGSKDAQNNWINRVLGFQFPARDDSNLTQRWQAAHAHWRAANDAVDEQITELQKTLRATEEEDLREIADFRLSAVTGGFKTGVMAALIEIGDGEVAALRKHAAKTLNLLQGLRSQIEADKRVVACDTNPFGCASPSAARSGLH